MLIPILLGAGVVALVFSTRSTKTWDVKRGIFGTRPPRANVRGVPVPALTSNQFTTSFPGNPLEVVFTATSGPYKGQEAPAIAAGESANPDGSVTASIEYASMSGSYTNYVQLPWMPPSGTKVRLFPGDVDLLRTATGEVIH